MLVEADSPLEAFEAVYEKLAHTGETIWFDWHHAQNPTTLDYAGRWSNSVFYTPNKNGDPDPDAEATNYLCYADDPALAEMVIEKFVQYRLDSIRDSRKHATDILTCDYDPFAKDELDMPAYYASKLSNLLNNTWTSDSAIFDLVDWTGNLSAFLGRVKDNPKKQYLVPVDFHH